jgi:ppGpp synthetase/RelA/SpoT-type nucleotidyltranferase
VQDTSRCIASPQPPRAEDPVLRLPFDTILSASSYTPPCPVPHKYGRPAAPSLLPIAIEDSYNGDRSSASSLDVFFLCRANRIAAIANTRPSLFSTMILASLTSTLTSTPDSNLNQKVKVFLEEYKKPETQKLFNDLAKATRQKCEDILKSIKIKGVVQSRSKGYDSLETKLNDMAKISEFERWIAGIDDDGSLYLPSDSSNVGEETQKIGRMQRDKQERDIYEHPDMGDLAGVRIGLFLPGDIAKVAQKIEETFDVSHIFGTVTDPSRTAVDGRNQDIKSHGVGPWISQGPDGDVHHWEHYGYKSWQVVVVWRRPLPKDIRIIEDALVSTGISGPLRVEIQVGTVVTQAWAEVQHNIIYKSSNDIQATPTMKRMIDAINGLAITTDIMLEELERSQQQAEKEAEDQRKFNKEFSETLLISASRTGDYRRVKQLLEDGVDVNAADIDQRTALHHASLRGHVQVVGLLLARDDIDVNATTLAKWTALHHASVNGHEQVVELLLARDGVNVNAADIKQVTALHRASVKGNENIVKQLLTKVGVDVNARNNRQRTALDVASLNGHENIVQLLRDKGGKWS